MIQVTIKNKSGTPTHQHRLGNQALAEAWVAEAKLKDAFGFTEKWVQEDVLPKYGFTPEDAVESKDMATEMGLQKFYRIPDQFSVEYLDITEEDTAQKQLEADRKKARGDFKKLKKSDLDDAAVLKDTVFKLVKLMRDN